MAENKKTPKKASKKSTKKVATKAAKKKTPSKDAKKKAAKAAPTKKVSAKAAKVTKKKSAKKKTVKTTTKAKKATKTSKKKPAKTTSKKKVARKTPKAATKKPAAKTKEIDKTLAKAVTPATAPVKKKKAVFKMTPFIKKQHQRLLDLRDQFINAIKGISNDTLRNSNSEISANGMHQGDAGSDAYDRDYALSILAKEQDALYEIERAIHRVETGSYGICQMSGEQIPQVRLEVLPFARLTVECQTLWEDKYGKKRYTIREGASFTELK